MENSAEAVACTCAHLADERKAERIVVLEVAPLTVLAEYFVITTGRNERQIRAIVEEVRHRMRELEHTPLGVEGEPESGWVLIDLGDVIVHVFAPELRELYDLEMLWGDADRVDWAEHEPLVHTAPLKRPSTEF